MPADNTPRAIVAIVVATLVLASGDAMIKLTSNNLVLWQIFTLRSLIVFPVLVLFIRSRLPRLPLLPVNFGWTMLRSFLLATMWIAYYIALPHVALSVAASAYYTLPMFIALLGALFLGERVSRVGWIAILLGFAGVILILKPDPSGFNAFTLLPVGSAILYSLAMILTRSRCRDENVYVLSLWLNISMLSLGLLGVMVLNPALIHLVGPGEYLHTYAFIFAPWVSTGLNEWLILGGLATSILVGSIAAAIAYQLGRPSTIATFDFTYIAFAAIWGFLLFQEIPDTSTVCGILLIVGAGILAVRQPGSQTKTVETKTG